MLMKFVRGLGDIMMTEVDQIIHKRLDNLEDGNCIIAYAWGKRLGEVDMTGLISV